MDNQERSRFLNSFMATHSSSSQGVMTSSNAVAACKAGVVAALRALKTQSVIGLVISTACARSSLRIIDQDGGILTSQWESFVNSLANAGDPAECIQMIEKFVTEENISLLESSGEPAAALVWLGRNTICTNGQEEYLMEAAKQGISSTTNGAIAQDMGILTTPQMCWFIRARNKSMTMNASEDEYLQQLSTAYRSLVDLIPVNELSTTDPTETTTGSEKLVVDGANGVGVIKLKLLNDLLCDYGLALDIRNSPGSGDNDDSSVTPTELQMGVEFVQKSKTLPSSFTYNDLEFRCVSLDAEAERLVYFHGRQPTTTTHDGDDEIEIECLAHDKMLCLFALFIRDQLSILDQDEVENEKTSNVRLGIIVQAAAAEDSDVDRVSPAYLSLGFDVVLLDGDSNCTMHHEAAANYDIGIYWTPDMRGTILFSESCLKWLESVNTELSSAAEGSSAQQQQQQAALRLLAVSKLMNQAAPDALSGLLMVEAVLRYKGWSLQQWNDFDISEQDAIVRVETDVSTVNVLPQFDSLPAASCPDIESGVVEDALQSPSTHHAADDVNLENEIVKLEEVSTAPEKIQQTEETMAVNDVASAICDPAQLLQDEDHTLNSSPDNDVNIASNESSAEETPKNTDETAGLGLEKDDDNKNTAQSDITAAVKETSHDLNLQFPASTHIETGIEDATQGPLNTHHADEVELEHGVDSHEEDLEVPECNEQTEERELKADGDSQEILAVPESMEQTEDIPVDDDGHSQEDLAVPEGIEQTEERAISADRNNQEDLAVPECIKQTEEKAVSATVSPKDDKLEPRLSQDGDGTVNSSPDKKGSDTESSEYIPASDKDTIPDKTGAAELEMKVQQSYDDNDGEGPISMSGSNNSSEMDTNSNSEAVNGESDVSEAEASCGATEETDSQVSSTTYEDRISTTTDASLKSVVERRLSSGSFAGDSMSNSLAGDGSSPGSKNSGSLNSKKGNSESQDDSSHLLEPEAEATPSVETRNYPEEDVTDHYQDDDNGTENNKFVDANATNQASTSNSEGLDTADAPVRENIGPVQFNCYYLAKVPRYIDPKLHHEMIVAQGQEAQLSSRRDAVFREYTRAKRQTANLRQAVNAAEKEVILAQDRVKATRKEMDSVHLLVKLAKDAMTVKELEGKISEMENKINQNDEVVPPREKKKLISDMGQANQLRDELHLSVNNNHQGVEQALEEKEKNEEHLKELRKVHNALIEWASKSEENLKTARNKHEKQKAKLTELESQWQYANHLAGNIFSERVCLNQLIKAKVQHYNEFETHLKLANQYAAADDKVLLEQHCINQVEAFMSKWNSSKEFRNEYVRCNSESNVKRFGTMDGRYRGHNEVPALLAYVPVFTPNYYNYPSAKVAPAVPKFRSNIVLQEFEENNETDNTTTTGVNKKVVEHKKKLKNVVVAPRKAIHVQDQDERFHAGPSEVKIGEEKEEADDVRKEKEEALKRKGKEKLKRKDETEWKRKGNEEFGNSEEEEELKRKKGELKKAKEEEAARLKCFEQEKIKAEKKALERKGKMVPNATDRAELKAREDGERLQEKRCEDKKIKAQKKALEKKGKMVTNTRDGAELKATEDTAHKEKKREKKVNKKTKKTAANAGPSTTPTSGADHEVSPGRNTSNEQPKGEDLEIKAEDKEEQTITTTTKRSEKTRQTKKNKTISSPPRHLRHNEARRRMIQQVVWTFLTLVVLFSLFFLANDNFLVIRKFFGFN